MNQRVKMPPLSLTLVYTFEERVQQKIRNFLAALCARYGEVTL